MRGSPSVPSLRTHLLNGVLRLATRRRLATAAFDRPFLHASRHAMDARGARFRVPAGVRVEHVVANGVPCEQLRGPAARDDATLLYLHGGAFVLGSPLAYRPLTLALAQRFPGAVVVPDYRLAPEHPWPAALDDAEQAWQALHDAGQAIVLAGDSAGGNLVFALLQRLRARGAPMPRAAIGLSPWTDLSGCGESHVDNRHRDAMLPAARIREAAALYVGADADLTDPQISPLFGDWRAAPPVLLHVGSGEVLRDDSVRLAHRLCAAGAGSELRIWPHQPHVFPAFASVLPEGRRALREMLGFAARSLAVHAAH